tara:strand:- start:861 stop:1358 length:498 start_codon:yes stop_codon:yes gene_type:complete
MWAIMKIDLNKTNLMIEDLKKKLGKDFKFYSPKVNIQILRNNRLVNRSIPLLGNYIFCFHQNFKSSKMTDKLKFVKGLKSFIYGYHLYQKEIELFIDSCKSLENKNGFISKSFLDLNLNKLYKFKSGILTDKIFELVEFQKNKIKILINGLKIQTNNNHLIFNHN